VNELRALVDSNFSSFVCLFKRRECNRAAHALADLGYECVEGEDLITSSVPNVVNVIVTADRLAVE
jgi:hypothetical protein